MTLIVPVVASTAMSMKSILPVDGAPVSLGGLASTRSVPAAMYASARGSIASGTANDDVDRRDPVDADDRRRVVGAHQVAGVRSRPVRPADRRLIVAYSQLDLRVLDVGAIGGDRRLERRRVGDDLIDLLLRRDAALEQILVARRLRLALAACATSRSSGAWACCSAASSGRLSIANSTWPSLTSSPSMKCTAVSSPVTWARTVTVDAAITVPMP